ncbi:MAG: serine/threonine-protein kinase [Kiloniellaceae bacterium]
MKLGSLIASRYIVQKHIGQGGMQEVYLAADKLLGIDVALKTPQAGQPNKRFSNSAKIAARINHHNVAKTFDYFESDDGELFLIEEYVPGETLEDKMRRFKVVDPHLGARIFHHLSKGIAASHHAGVVHRDIKPSNVIAEPGVNLHQLKITDFGIATLTEEVFAAAAKDGDLTRSTSGTIKGALPYMAPEMMFRSPGEYPGPPVDIWSLGALMFRILTGEYPFGVYLEAAVNVRNGVRRSWPAFMRANAQFAPLATKLQEIVESCLQYEPEKRPSADDLVTELSGLCYLNVHRTEGRVINLIQNGYSGFAEGPEGKVFFSMQSVYGTRKPSKAKNAHICYSKFPGLPHGRGHPIVVID